MISIEKLDSEFKDKFRHPASRLIQACRRVTGYHHANPIARDIIAEVEATAAWMVVTCSYTGIEQSMKCLLQMRGAYIDKVRKKGGHRHHCIGELFELLSSEEKDVIRAYYSVYRMLHDYVPPKTADCFLSAIDDGYPTWRYFLLENNQPPTTHCGAMVEIWTALSDILCARVFTNHGLQTVDRRIWDQLNRLILVDTQNQVDTVRMSKTVVCEFNQWRMQHGSLIAAFADLFRRRATNSMDTLDFSECTLDFLQKAARIAEGDETNQDFCLFVRRARDGDLPREFLGIPL